MIPHSVTAKELADVLGVTPRRIAQMVGEGMPRGAKGYDLAACCRWYIERLRKGAASVRSELAEGRARLAQARADREELELATRRGALVDAEEVRRAIFAAARASRDIILGVPHRVAPLILGITDQHEAIRILTDEMRRACAELTAIKLRDANAAPR